MKKFDVEIKKLNEKALVYSKKILLLEKEINKVIVGQEEIISKVITGILAKGHVLIEGVPGLAKTLLIKTLSDAIGGSFVRIQFTPDLLPADIIGTKIYNQKTGSFKTMKGPVFANFVLADEINRAPPKVQSALLEAMQERQVSIQGETISLPRPFMVLATQNPIENEGTYQLPEAQVDRFMQKILIDHPSKDEEEQIIKRFTQGENLSVKKIISLRELIEIQEFIPKIYCDEIIIDYVATIVDATRNPDNYDLDIKDFIEYGASPRASIWLIMSSKARALMEKRGFVKPEDVRESAFEILRHRIILTYEAEAEGITTDIIIRKILDKIKTP